jgi:TolB-like protein
MVPLALLLALALAPVERRVAVLPVADGVAQDPSSSRSTVHGRVSAEIVAGFSRDGAVVVPSAEVAAAIEGPCNDAACVRAVASQTGARWVVRALVEHSDRSYALELELLDGTSGEVVARNRDACDICGLEEVAKLTADQAAVLQREIAALERVQTSLRVESTPAGARVWLDGELVGVTPLVRPTTPGRHRLRLEHEGYIASERDVEAIEDVEKQERLQLAPLPVDAKARRRAPLVPLGAAALVGGVALTVGGAVLVALDERQYRRQCSGDYVDVNGTCRFSYDTLAGGATSLGLGVATIGAGIAMVVVGKRRERRSSVALGPRGVVIRGRF